MCDVSQRGKIQGEQATKDTRIERASEKRSMATIQKRSSLREILR